VDIKKDTKKETNVSEDDVLLKELLDSVEKLNSILLRAADAGIEVKLSQVKVGSYISPLGSFVTFHCYRDITPAHVVNPTGGLSFLATMEQS
jgi:hypothetical protein